MAIRGKTLHPRSDSGLDSESDLFVFGVDEVGAGCLAGPVVAGAFAYKLSAEWTKEEIPVRIFDSKKLSLPRRLEARDFLSSGLSESAHSIIEVTPERIDKINILQARMEAMWLAFLDAHKKISAQRNSNDFLWRLYVDGNRLPKQTSTWAESHDICPLSIKHKMPRLPFKTQIKGDSVIFAIAAASVIAKVYRDQLMANFALDSKYASYGWEKNVGYPTPDHKAALNEHGRSDLHRQSFSF